jgi:hypothetical protein
LTIATPAVTTTTTTTPTPPPTHSFTPKHASRQTVSQVAYLLTLAHFVSARLRRLYCRSRRLKEILANAILQCAKVFLACLLNATSPPGPNSASLSSCSSRSFSSFASLLQLPPQLALLLFLFLFLICSFLLLSLLFSSLLSSFSSSPSQIVLLLQLLFPLLSSFCSQRGPSSALRTSTSFEQSGSHGAPKPRSPLSR